MPGHKKILIIEENSVVRAKVKELLIDENFEVNEAETGIKDLEKVKSETPDLVASSRPKLSRFFSRDRRCWA